ncbi:hypothetical protein PN497_15745 [Sphaerospermopsis kisseleviana CS-549]|uniref:Uncharacterized protein n=1 Tax=Sphaerospermopsis kisseleviana CS-549 TaxID=3021783 RepID=A0ABT4ZTQ3_9CYAN|nr:hypothetical protein [Sphaerospermopsis kisseleviana]MDB9442803.1 hypothetical protein [Sphaerospermopsis kisseleviana CS-549]
MKLKCWVSLRQPNLQNKIIISQSPITSPQSPVPSHQSPVPSPQSPKIWNLKTFALISKKP